MEANNKAMHEALEKVKDAFETDTIYAPTTHPSYEMVEEVRKVYKTVLDALAAPPRNCDVGTAEEQVERWRSFCAKYDDDCTGCPCNDAVCASCTECFARWAYLPYEEGSNDADK